MIFSPKELSMINIVLTATPDRQPRTFGFTELTTAFSIHEKIMKNTETKDELEVFIEGDIEFTSEENVFITRFIKEFKFNVADGGTVANLLTKLV